MNIRHDVPLAPMTTFELGGAARRFACISNVEELREALDFARREDLDTFVLGGGSNVLVADEGFFGLVLTVSDDSQVLVEDGERPLVRVGAGKTWDDFAAWSVAADLAGVECLAGIPGQVGASPIQNIGAYGQEAGDAIEAVHVVERGSGREQTLTSADCAFGYRDSFFKREGRDRYVVTKVDFRLHRGGRPSLRYGELTREMEDKPLTLASVRDAVLAIRKRKSMLAAPDDPNRRNAGSFFTNPILPAETAAVLKERFGQMPTYEAGEGRAKLSAAWLIENAGFPKGYGKGPAGLSSAHTLCLVNRGEARTSDILALAKEIQQGVQTTFGVELTPEATLLGF